MKMGAYDFLPKPFTPSELRMIIDRGFERWRLARETQLLRRAERGSRTQVRHAGFPSAQRPPGLRSSSTWMFCFIRARIRLPEKAVEWISRSQVRIAEMLTLIQDWLMLAKLDRGALCDRSASSDIGKIVENIVQEYQATALGCGIAAERRNSAGPPAGVRRCRQPQHAGGQSGKQRGQVQQAGRDSKGDAPAETTNGLPSR